MSYIFIGQVLGLGDWVTPYGRQSWTLCRTRKPFTCVKSGRKFPAGEFAWRPTGNPKNRADRIAVDHSLDTRSIASIVVGHPEQSRLVKALLLSGKSTPLHQLSHYARLNHRRAMTALAALEKQGLVHVVDEWGPTADWWQDDDTEHQSFVIDWVER